MDIEPIKQEQLKYIGEKTALRFYNPQNPEDLIRMKSTLVDKGVKKFVEGIDNVSLKDIKNWLERYNDKERIKDWEVCYLVSGSSNVKLEEFGEVQGFVNFYPNEEYRYLLSENYKKTKQVVGISYARYPGAKPGQISGAIRQACIEINKLKGNIEDEEFPKMTIIAFVREDNNASIKTVEDACFKNDGLVVINNDNKVERDFLYILDWKKLNDKLHAQVDDKILL